jgi:hypothetical protein
MKERSRGGLTGHHGSAALLVASGILRSPKMHSWHCQSIIRVEWLSIADTLKPPIREGPSHHPDLIRISADGSNRTARPPSRATFLSPAFRLVQTVGPCSLAGLAGRAERISIYGARMQTAATKSRSQTERTMRLRNAPLTRNGSTSRSVLPLRSNGYRSRGEKRKSCLEQSSPICPLSRDTLGFPGTASFSRSSPRAQVPPPKRIPLRK